MLILVYFMIFRYLNLTFSPSAFIYSEFVVTGDPLNELLVNRTGAIASDPTKIVQSSFGGIIAKFTKLSRFA